MTKAIAVWISPNTPLTMNSGRLAAPCCARRSRSYEVEILEEGEVELRGVIHDLELDRVRDPLLEQLLADVPEGRQERRRRVDRRTGRRRAGRPSRRHRAVKRPDGTIVLGRLGSALTADRPDDGIDQQLGDVGRDGRDDAARGWSRRQDRSSGSRLADQTRPRTRGNVEISASTASRPRVRRPRRSVGPSLGGSGISGVAAQPALAAFAMALLAAQPVTPRDDGRVIHSAWFEEIVRVRTGAAMLAADAEIGA